jgi:hypothetical protein
MKQKTYLTHLVVDIFRKTIEKHLLKIEQKCMLLI